jgi:hypothetical protein
MHKTQKQQVLEHLRQHGYITPAQAMSQYKIYRLASIIRRLRLDGHEIINTGKDYGVYELAGVCKDHMSVYIVPDTRKIMKTKKRKNSHESYALEAMVRYFMSATQVQEQFGNNYVSAAQYILKEKKLPCHLVKENVI